MTRAASPRTTLEALAGSEGPIVVLSGSCAATMLHAWPELFEGDARAAGVLERVVEFGALLAPLAAAAPALGARRPVAFHCSCHQRRGLRDTTSGAALINSLPGVELVEQADAEACCGFGGTFAIKFPDVSTAMGRDKVTAVHEAGAAELVSGDVGCLMHLGRRGRRDAARALRRRRCPSCSSARAGRREHRLRRRQGARRPHRQGARRHAPGHDAAGPRGAICSAFAPRSRSATPIGRSASTARARSAATPWPARRSCSTRFEAAVTSRGGSVIRAATGDDAVRAVLEIARRRGVKVVAKGKSMVSEEIELNHALEAAGLTPVETDLGEWIVQLAGERPSHILAPVIHRSRGQIAEVLAAHRGGPMSDDPQALVTYSREQLRSVFLEAGMGITGANFMVAETGTVVRARERGQRPARLVAAAGATSCSRASSACSRRPPTPPSWSSS